MTLNKNTHNELIVLVKAFPSSKKEKINKTSDNEFIIFVKEPAQNNLANKRIAEILSNIYSSRAIIISGVRSSKKKFKIMI